jgi:hypothetical protein
MQPLILEGSQDLPEKSTTVGQQAVGLLMKGDQKQGVIDTQREMQKGYLDNVIEAAKRGEELFGKESPFYVCVQTRRERLLSNVIRNQFYPRQTRPIPQYDLSLFWYDPKSEDLKFVWCIPDKETVEFLIQNENILPDDQHQLVQFCKSFKDNTLI